MRLGTFCIIVLLLSAELASSQTPKPASPSPTPALPEFRPALLGTGPDAMINKIDTADLIKKGQKDAAVMFSCLVAPPGTCVPSACLPAPKGSTRTEHRVL